MGRSSRIPGVTLELIGDAVRLLELARTHKTDAELKKAVGAKNWDATRKRLAQLKDMFDPDFLDRDAVQPLMNPRAEEFILLAKTILRDIEALFRPNRFGVRKVVVATYPSVLTSFLESLVVPKLVGQAGAGGTFAAAYPLYELEFRQVTSAEEGMRQVELRAADCAIIDRHESTAPDRTANGFERIHLFGSVERGFLYHRANASFERLVRKSFQWKDVSKFNLFLSIGDRWAVEQGYLPDPDRGRATRVFVHSYAQVLAAVSANLGIGIGFRPKAITAHPEVVFVGFEKVQSVTGSTREDVTINRAIHNFTQRAKYTFDIYLRALWDRDAKEGGLSAAAKMVVKLILAEGARYTHDYQM